MANIGEKVGTQEGIKIPYIFFGPYTNQAASLDETQIVLNNLANPHSSEGVYLESARLFDRFLNDPSSEVILKAIQDHDASDPGFRRVLAGRVFEEITTYAIRGRYRSNYKILSPEQTFYFFSRVHADRPSCTEYGISSGIMGVSFPDNLVLRDARKTWVVQAVVEAKSNSKKHYRDTNYQTPKYLNSSSLFKDYSDTLNQGSEHLGRFLSEIRPDLTVKPVAVSKAGYEVVVAVPQGSELSIEYHARRVIIPVPGEVFAKFLSALITDCSK